MEHSLDEALQLFLKADLENVDDMWQDTDFDNTKIWSLGIPELQDEANLKSFLEHLEKPESDQTDTAKPDNSLDVLNLNDVLDQNLPSLTCEHSQWLHDESYTGQASDLPLHTTLPNMIWESFLPQSQYPQSQYPQSQYPQPHNPQLEYLQPHNPQPYYPWAYYPQSQYPQLHHPQSPYPQLHYPQPHYPQLHYPQLHHPQPHYSQSQYQLGYQDQQHQYYSELNHNEGFHPVYDVQPYTGCHVPLQPQHVHQGAKCYSTSTVQGPDPVTKPGYDVDDLMYPTVRSPCSQVQDNCSELPNKSKRNSREKPNKKYRELIAKAIMSTEEQRMHITEIYDYFMTHHKWFTKDNHKSWQNSIRSNLTAMDCFRKGEEVFGKGRGNYWYISDSCKETFKNNNFDDSRCKRSTKKSDKHSYAYQFSTGQDIKHPTSSEVDRLAPLVTGIPAEHELQEYTYYYLTSQTESSLDTRAFLNEQPDLAKQSAQTDESSTQNANVEVVLSS